MIHAHYLKYRPVPPADLTHAEIMKLLALSRAGLLQLDGVKQKVWLENGQCWLAAAPCYIRSAATFISLPDLRKLLEV